MRKRWVAFLLVIGEMVVGGRWDENPRVDGSTQSRLPFSHHKYESAYGVFSL